MEEKIIERYPPRCRSCFYPDQDDKERVLVRFINPENKEKSYAVKCPNINTSNGMGCINFSWLAGRKQASINQPRLWDYRDKDKINEIIDAPNRRGYISDTLTPKKLEDLYYTQNKSLQDIANEYKCTRPMIKLLMEKYGLKRRTRDKARVLAIKEGKFNNFFCDDINESFFSEWSPAMTWVLGLLFTDGCISGGRVSIYSVDIQLLEKVKNLLGSSKSIAKKVQSYDKSKHIYRFEFYRKKMRDDLLKLGLIQRKSLIMQFPEIPEEYMRHFIRGCWDGDGSVYISNGKLNASYVCGSKDFIKRLILELFKIGIHRKKHLKYKSHFGTKFPVAIHKSKRSKSYSIKLNTQENIVTLFHYFYDGVDESMYLSRKYTVFVEGLRLKN